MLPLIDLNLSDESWIYSTLIDHAKYLNIEILCVNFNQLLWIKAFEIVKIRNLMLVLCLAVFHNLMSFVGSVGFSKVFETDYGKNTVIFSGKAISKALRFYFLVNAALSMKLIKWITIDINEKVTENTADQDVSISTSLSVQVPLFALWAFSIHREDIKLGSSHRSL